MTIRIILGALALSSTVVAFHTPSAGFRGQPFASTSSRRCLTARRISQHDTDMTSCQQQQQQTTSRTRSAHRKPSRRAGVPSLRSSASSAEEGSRASNSDGSAGGSGAQEFRTLGIAYSVLKPTVVPALSGAVLKQAPSDFVVVEIPLTGRSVFTPEDTEARLADNVRSPDEAEIPDETSVRAAINEWKERWPTPLQEPDQPKEREKKALWDLAKGFDGVAKWLGESSSLKLQAWLLQVAVRNSFNNELEKTNDNDVFLPPVSPDKETLFACPPTLDKAGRTELHAVFRNYMSYLSTRAVMPGTPSRNQSQRNQASSDGTTYFMVTCRAKDNGRVSWPKGRGEYLEFSVYKAGRSTHEVVEALSRRLRVTRGRLSFAGAKDRRAITAQKIRCWRLKAEDVCQAQASGGLAKDGLAVSDYRYVQRDLSLGQLRGNYFEVLLRPPPGGWKTSAAAAAAGGGVGDTGSVTAAEALRSLRDKGFVNFFGSQRFGRDGTTNVEVGKLLLKSNWQAAVNRILARHPADTLMVANAKDQYFKGEGTGSTVLAALTILPRNAFVERSILMSLNDTKDKDPLGALLNLSMQLRLLFIQSYQSLLWNTAVSWRMSERFDRTKAVEGDLVLYDLDKNCPLTVWETHQINEEAQPPSPSKKGAQQDINPPPNYAAILVSKNDAELGTFGIEHVVIPLAGHSVQYPTNVVGQGMLNYLKQDGLYNIIMKGHQHPAFDLKGAYRHVVVHPQNFGVERVPVGPEAVPDEPEVEFREDRESPERGMLPQSTAAWLRAHFKEEISKRFRSARGEFSTINDGNSFVEAGNKAPSAATVALRLSFALPQGAYATIMLQHLTGESSGETLEERGRRSDEDDEDPFEKEKEE